MKRLKTILLIDDDAPTLFLNKLVIQDLDCTDKILTAENGRQAIEMLTEETDQGFLCPDLILLISICLLSMVGSLWTSIKH